MWAEVWAEVDFAKERRARFWTQIRYWFPTSDMLWGYWHSYIAVLLLRLIFGWIPIAIPGGLSRTRPMTRALLTGPIDNAFLQRWEDLAHARGNPSAFDPATLKGYLMPPLFPSRGIRVEATQNRTLYYYLIYRQDDGGGVYCRRIVRPVEGYAYHDVVYADPSGGGNIASDLLFSAIRFYLVLGVRVIRIRAGFNVGGLLWPKYGFRPTTGEEWEIAHETIRKNLGKLPDNIREMVAGEVEDILASENPRAIWRFAALNKRRASIKAQERGVGDLMLHRTRWQGILELDDPRARDILVARLGPLRGSQIETEISLTKVDC